MKIVMTISLQKITLLAVLVLFVSNVFATRIIGTVLDEKGYPVIGSYVRLLKENKQVVIAIADFDGIYSLNAPAGEYTLMATYMGKDTFKKEVVLSGTAIEENILLLNKRESGSTGVVRVTTKRQTNTANAGLLKEKSADGVVSVIGAEQMAQTGVSNVTAGVKQLPGVSVEQDKYITVRGLGDRYTKGLLNGMSIPSPDAMKNSVQMDIFPSNIVDNVQIYKSFTPDLPGDFTGGLVNITTRDFPAKETFSVSVSESFNPYSNLNSDFATYDGGNLDFLGIDDGSRDLPTGALNIPDRYEAGNVDVAKSFTNNWALKKKTPFLNSSISMAYGNQYKIGGEDSKMKLGFISSLSYSHSSSRIEDGFVGRWTVPSAGPNGSTELNPEKEYEFNKSQESASWTAMVGNTLKLNRKHKIGLNLLYSQNGTKNAMKLEGKWHDQPSDAFVSQAQLFQERNFGNAQLKGTHMLFDSLKLKMTWSTAYTIGKQNNPDNRYFQYEYNNLANGERMYEMNTNYAEPTRLFQKMDENNFDNNINFSLPFKFRRNDSKFKTGAAYATKSRNFNENRYDFPDAKGTLLTDAKGNLTDFFNQANADVNQGWYVEDGSELRNSYEAQQSIIAAYAMVDVALNEKLKVTTGARVEIMDLTVESADKDKDIGNLKRSDILPSVQANYSVNKKTNLRLGYGRTVARPTFREIAPFTTFSFDQPPVKGNPLLDRTLIDNFDLKWETYPNIGEVVSFGMFYKNMYNPIGQAYVPQAANTEIQMVNLPSASVAGVEFEFKKSFANIVGEDSRFKWVSNFNLGFNTTYIYSVSKIEAEELAARQEVDPDASKTRPLLSQSPFLINAIIGYKNNSLGLIMNVTYNVFGKRLVITSQGALPDIYEQSRQSLNVVLGKQITKKFKVSFKAQNLLNPETKLSHEFKGEEFVYSTFRTGRRFSLGLSYKF